MVLLIDNLASGNNTFDNLSKVAYVSFVRETFLYFTHVCHAFPFIFNNSYIGDIIGLSMKILLTLVLCSQIATNLFGAIPEWPERFDTQYDCLMFGYEESMNKMKEIGRELMSIKHNMFVKFYCTPEKLFDIVAE